LSKLSLRDLLAATPANDHVAITMVLLFARGVTTLQSVLTQLSQLARQNDYFREF